MLRKHDNTQQARQQEQVAEKSHLEQKHKTHREKWKQVRL